MSTDEKVLEVAGLKINVVRKDIKNLHLGVYPPAGRVRVAAPRAISDDAVRLAVIDKLAWIKLQRSKFEQQPRQSRRDMAAGESHYVFGRRYRLRVREHDGKPHIATRGVASLEMFVRPGTSIEQREELLARWYRDQLKAVIAPMIAKWATKLAVQPSAWGVKRMKTKWGSCTRDMGRLWFNSELAKKPVDCIEYIVVHELVHLLEAKHGERFSALMDQHLPRWRATRERLNAAPLGHEIWDY
jgi:predicted metal-dependent hydrolase